MGKGTEKTLVRDFNKVAQENDQLRQALGQQMQQIASLQQQAAELAGQYRYVTKLLGAACNDAGGKLLVTDKSVASLPEDINITRERAENDTGFEYRIITKAEADNIIRKAQEDASSTPSDGGSDTPESDGSEGASDPVLREDGESQDRGVDQASEPSGEADENPQTVGPILPVEPNAKQD